MVLLFAFSVHPVDKDLKLEPLEEEISEGSTKSVSVFISQDSELMEVNDEVQLCMKSEFQRTEKFWKVCPWPGLTKNAILCSLI